MYSLKSSKGASKSSAIWICPFINPAVRRFFRGFPSGLGLRCSHCRIRSSMNASTFFRTSSGRESNWMYWWLAIIQRYAIRLRRVSHNGSRIGAPLNRAATGSRSGDLLRKEYGALCQNKGMASPCSSLRSLRRQHALPRVLPPRDDRALWPIRATRRATRRHFSARSSRGPWAARKRRPKPEAISASSTDQHQRTTRHPLNSSPASPIPAC